MSGDGKDKMHMQRLLTLAAVSLAAVAVSGCATAPRAGLTAENNTSLYSLHQPVVERTDYVFDVTSSGDRISDAELNRLDAWFDSIGLRYGDRLSVDEPGGYASEGARRDIARIAARYGILISEGAPVTAGDIQPGSVRIIASRAHAHVPDCPTWSDPGIVATTTTSSNYGCSINSNLAAMVADPDDLVLGREGSVNMSGATATRAIHTYRTRPATGSQALPSTTTSSSQGGN
jgi:pilus assembly protein CpaD